MGVYELESNNVRGTSQNLKDECLIAFKVYDSCRQQNCLNDGIIGPARAARNTSYCGIAVSEGEIIVPPTTAASVTISDLKVERVVIVSKKQSNFKVGYWDIDLKYVFAYKLAFRDISGDVLCTVCARSVYNKMVTLFGSITTNSVISTDLLCGSGSTLDINADPFVYVESKAVALKAELKYENCCCASNGEDADAVSVTIGLFAIIKLYRIVNLVVSSRGFCVPDVCEDTDFDPCDFFDDLDFPMDTFAPPQKPEFVAGISNNIPACKPKKPCGCGGNNNSNNNNNNCGCGCGNNNNNCNNNTNSNGCGCRNNCRR